MNEIKKKALNGELGVKQYRNSPVISNSSLMGDDDDKKAFIGKVMNELLEYIDAPRVTNSEEAKERIAQYFIRCAERGIRPTIEELALALGTTRRTLWSWETGESHAVDSNIIIKAKEIIASFDAKAVIDNKMNPVTYFFRAKNYYGMRDQQEVVLTPNSEGRDKKTLIAEADLLPDLEENE